MLPYTQSQKELLDLRSAAVEPSPSPADHGGLVRGRRGRVRCFQKPNSIIRKCYHHNTTSSVHAPSGWGCGGRSSCPPQPTALDLQAPASLDGSQTQSVKHPQHLFFISAKKCQPTRAVLMHWLRNIEAARAQKNIPLNSSSHSGASKPVRECKRKSN